MTVGIIGAMDEEIAYLENKMTEKATHQIANSLFIEGNIGDKSVVLVKSGIGKVNAAMTTTILVERFSPAYIINTGSAGGFDPELEVGNIVISTEVAHHDVDVTAFDYAYGQVPGMPATFHAHESLITRTKQATKTLNIKHACGLIVTGDSFMNNETRINQVISQFPGLLAAEMEGAAIAQVCHQYDVPFVIVRALSDIAGKDAPMSFQDFLNIAAENAANLILTMIQADQ